MIPFIQKQSKIFWGSVVISVYCNETVIKIFWKYVVMIVKGFHFAWLDCAADAEYEQYKIRLTYAT